MKSCQCSQCGSAASSYVWGWALLVRDGWSIAPATTPPGAVERAWLCAACTRRAENVASGMIRLSAPKRERVRIDRPLRVLLVDDQVLVLRALARQLSECETVSVKSALEAWRLLEGGAQFDVIVSDVMMPDLSGPELYALCHERSALLAKRFVFASGDEIAAQALITAAAARVFVEQAPPLLRKPVSQALLLATVSAVATRAAHDSGTYELRLPKDVASEPNRVIERAARGKPRG